VSGTFLLIARTVVNKSGWQRGVFPPGTPSDSYVLQAVNAGTPGDAVIDVPFNGDGQLQLDFDTSTSIFVDGSGTPTLLADLPAGFTVTAAVVHSYLTFATGGSPTDFQMYLSFDPLTVSGLLHPVGSTSDITFAWPGLMPSMLDLVNGGVGVRAVGDGATRGVILQTTSTGTLFITGAYDIVSTSWVIPDPATSPDGTGEAGTGTPAAPSGPTRNDVRNACGVPTESHVVYSPSSPGDGYVSLASPPTPVIDSVTPPGGTTVGGQPVTIRGAGFDDGATVTFDGVSATSVVIVSQFEITCVTPAHVAGSADVIVTNSDGTPSAP
jgi:hypothetical protein